LPAESELGLTAPRSELWRPWTVWADRAIGSVVEPVAAVLIAFEVVILGAGVFARYVLNDALSWSDELATVLFLWISMLGAVAAMRRGTHLRLAYVVNRAGPERAEWLKAISWAVTCVFCIEMMFASKQQFLLELSALTPALAISRAWLVAPTIVAMILMFALAALRLIDTRARIALTVAGCTAALVVVAYLSRGVFSQLGTFALLVLFFVVLVGALIAIGVPIAFAFGTATLSFLALTTTIPLPVVMNMMTDGISNVLLLAVPLFVLLGLLMSNAGISSRLVNAIASLVGHLRGGLSLVVIVAMYLVSGISGSKSADMAAVAPVLFPEMRRRGLIPGEMVSLLNGSAAMTEMIPPSLILIIVGSATQVSITALFTAGLMPAALGGLLLAAVALWRARGDRAELPPRAAPRRIAKLFWIALPGLVLPLVIRAFVLGGVATATEVSTVGIVYSLLVGALIYRELNWARIFSELRETAVLNGTIMLIIASATAMSWALTQSGFARHLAQAVENAPGGATTFLVVSCLLFIVLGSVLEGVPAIVLFGPLLFPIAATLHIDQAHYAIVAILGMGIGLHAPPLGVGYYAACIIGKAPPDEVMPRSFPYLLAAVVTLICVAAFPWLSVGLLPKVH
jgi:tripartite ATP-independent transporter DctM subunit